MAPDVPDASRLVDGTKAPQMNVPAAMITTHTAISRRARLILHLAEVSGEYALPIASRFYRLHLADMQSRKKHSAEPK